VTFPVKQIAVGVAASLVLAPTLLIGALVAVETEPPGGPGHRMVDAIEQRIGRSDEIHYYGHEALGKILSFCPCTAGLSREQYRRAALHRRAW
jgi:hypothetical protein